MNKERENKWLILIEEKEVAVSLLTAEGKLLVSQEKGWDGEDPNSLVAGLDSGIGDCLAKEEGIGRPSQSIFILPPFWVSHRSQVLPTRKKILEHVCKQLNLTPEGFLVGEEVLANFYDNFTGVYFGSEYLRFSVIKDKTVEVQEELQNGEDIDPEDVSVFLRQLNGKAIVPQQIIFWGKIKEGNKDRLLTYDWQEEKLFDRSPKIKIVLWEEFFQLVGQVVQGEIELEVVEDKVESREPKPEIKAEKTEGQTFGFSNQDVAEEEDFQFQPQANLKPEPKPEEEQKTPRPKINLKEKLSKIKLPSLNFSFRSGKKRLKFLVIPFVLLGGLFLSWQFSKAVINIYVTPEELSEELEVRLSKEAKALDIDQGIIPVDEVSVEKTGSKSRAATGEKLIGEKAKGEVTIFNRTSEKTTFESGTSLYGPGNLEFVLDSQVSVASKTADLATGVDRWGETTTSITAADIGSEYNLAEESLFTISDYPEDDYLGRNSESLSGGTSRKIRAVSDEDRENLKESLTEDLISQAEEELKSKLSDSQIIEGGFSTSIVSEEFSAEVDDEVDELKLDLTVQVTAAKISQERLIKIAQQVLGEKIESGDELREGSLRARLDIDEAVDNQDSISGLLILKGRVYPKIVSQELSQKLVKSKENRAKETIRQSYSRIYRYEIDYQFPWLKYFSYLPPKPENIIIEVRE